MLLLDQQFWRKFKRNRPAQISLFGFVVILLVSGMANVIANDQPLVMLYRGNFYFPAFVHYLPRDFGLSGFVMDYLALEPELQKEGWVVFPPLTYRPNDQNLNFEKLPAPPGATTVVGKTATYEGRVVRHYLGTDTGGRDLLTRLIYGCRTSVFSALAITLVSLILGIIVGSLMGYWGGRLDLIMGRVLEAFGHFPIIFLIIILVAFLEDPSLTMIIGIFSFFGLIPFAFYMRGEVLKIRRLTYVEAAHALGQNDIKIMFSHILPNAMSPVLVLIPFQITGNISLLAYIDFLGFGVQPPTASLGSLLRSGYEDIGNRWWLVASSSLVLVVILLLVNLIGDGARDGLDPYASMSKKEIANLKGSHEWTLNSKKTVTT